MSPAPIQPLPWDAFRGTVPYLVHTSESTHQIRFSTTEQNTSKLKEQSLKPKGKGTLQNQFSRGKVKPEINTSPMTNIWYYAHTQKQTSLFPLKSQERKKKLFRRPFGKDRNDSIILHSNFPCHQIRSSGKMNSRENVKTHYEPPLRTSI